MCCYASIYSKGFLSRPLCPAREYFIQLLALNSESAPCTGSLANSPWFGTFCNPKEAHWFVPVLSLMS